MADHSKYIRAALEKIKGVARSSSASRLKRKLEGKAKPKSGGDEGNEPEPIDEKPLAESDDEEGSEGLDLEKEDNAGLTELRFRGPKSGAAGGKEKMTDADSLDDKTDVPMKRGRGRPKKAKF